MGAQFFGHVVQMAPSWSLAPGVAQAWTGEQDASSTNTDGAYEGTQPMYAVTYNQGRLNARAEATGPTTIKGPIMSCSIKERRESGTDSPPPSV